MRTSILLAPLLALATVPASCQGPAPSVDQHESRFARDFRVEGEALGACKKFNLAGLSSCGQTLVLGQPLHIAVGSLAPQNGFGAGLAFVEHTNLKNEWRLTYNIDAMATANGSWRAGGYMQAFRLSGPKIVVVKGSKGSHRPFFNTAPLINLYSQTSSLRRVDFYGLGPNAVASRHTTYDFTENVTGVDARIPLEGAIAPAKFTLVAQLNGRFPTVRPGTDASLPSIGTLFNESTAPGLSRQTAYFQASEGLRINPALFKDRIRLNYLLQFQQFVAPESRAYSFRRWNADFSHEIPLYGLLGGKQGKLGKYYSSNRGALSTTNGPDDCTGSNFGQNISAKHEASKQLEARPCPMVSTTQKLEGTITLRLLLSESFAKAGSAVPFYLSPTLGGSDINGTSALASYPDYRFRGPDLILLRGTIEHSLFKLPVGVYFSGDGGKVALRRNDISFGDLCHSYSAGLTIHAGGLPLVYLLFAWGGSEGHHTIANVSPALLGGSARPSLF